MNFLKSFLIVSRANIQVASLPTASLGIVLAARTWAEMLQLSVPIYILLFFVILTFACQINCLHDLEVDKKHKVYMSDAVQYLGIANLKRIMALEIGLALVLIIFLSATKKDWRYLLAVGGLLIGYLYSAPPLRVKKRGLLSPFPVLFGLYFLPIVAGWFVIRGRLSVVILLFGLGYALIMQGITFINTCEDFEEDRLSGIHTLAHILGVRKALHLGSLCVFWGGILDLSLLLSCGVNRPVPRFALLALTALCAAFFTLSILRISLKLFSISRSPHPILRCKKEAGRMPEWFLTTRFPLLFMALLSIF